MIQFEINSTEEFKLFCWQLRSNSCNQVLLSLKNDVKHNFPLRLLHNKIIWVSNESLENKIEYSIRIIFDKTLSQKTKFDFAGQSTSEYNFSNLTFNYEVIWPIVSFDYTDYFADDISYETKEIIKSRNINLTETKEIKFMSISNNSKLNFLNCIFTNESNKIFIIEVWGKSIVTFVNCQFNGKFDLRADEEALIFNT